MASQSSTKPVVVLLHGLCRSAGSLKKIASTLSDQYHVLNIDYPSTKHTIEVLTSNHIQPQIERFLDDRQLINAPVHFVTHSMGAIILRKLAHQSTLNIANCVMLAPPNHGSEVVDKLGHLAPFYWLNGPAGRQLATKNAAHPKLESLPTKLGPVTFSCAVIAADNQKLWFRDPLSRLLPKPNDGKVSVVSTRVAEMKAHLCISASHTFIMNQKNVIKQVCFFLKHGKFDQD